MLAKPFRLPANVRLSNSKLYRTPLFLLKASSNELPYCRFGFVVGKSTDKRATARNRIKRLLRSCVEELLGQFRPGQDLLFFPHRSILEMKREELYNQVHAFLQDHNFLT
ncbi:MAG TPA: ribonuclease P protein component [Patescibacteria group bacterium]